MSVLDLVITTKEASLNYPVADCTIRSWILDGEFNDKDVRKSGQIWLVTRSGLEDILERKGLLNKRVVLEKKEQIVKYLGYKSKKIEIWMEDEVTYKMFKNIPNGDMIITLLEIYKKEYKLPFKVVVVVNNKEESDNSLYKKEKTWVITSKALYQILKDALDIKEIDTSELEEYFKSFNN